MPPVRIELAFPSARFETRIDKGQTVPIDVVEGTAHFVYGIRCNPEDNGATVTRYPSEAVVLNPDTRMRSIPGPKNGETIANVERNGNVELDVMTKKGGAALRVAHYDV